MICISSDQREPLRFFASHEPVEVHLYDRYGFVSVGSLIARQKQRKHSGAFVPKDSPRCRFRVASSNGQIVVEPLDQCSVAPADLGWKLKTERGIYFVESSTALANPSLIETYQAPFDWRPVLHLLMGVLFIVGIFAAVKMWPQAEVELKKAAESEVLPVVLKENSPPVKIEQPKQTAVDPQAKMRQKVSAQLGFLGLLGKKNFRKAVGGLPTPSAQTSPGAGAGGLEGSGGELLAGMGRGLHQATVGNSGVKGLGGIGTKGAGGGQGGYGDTSFGGAGGQLLSSIPLSQEAVMEEGLDRSQIQAAIARYLAQVRACYEEGLKRNQALIGQVTMNFEINAQGGVNYSRVQRSSLNDRPVEDCIGQKMLAWKFPLPRGRSAVKVSYPFMLRPVRN